MHIRTQELIPRLHYYSQFFWCYTPAEKGGGWYIYMQYWKALRIDMAWEGVRLIGRSIRRASEVSVSRALIVTCFWLQIVWYWCWLILPFEHAAPKAQCLTTCTCSWAWFWLQLPDGRVPPRLDIVYIPWSIHSIVTISIISSISNLSL